MNREYGESVMVRMDRSVHEQLCKAKLIPREPLSDCIARILKENDELKAKLAK
jgi:hypothetical protein